MTEHARFLATGSVDGAINEDSRTISWIFSNEDVCLDFHTISANGWVLDDYRRNPVILFAHDQSQPSIARVPRIETRGKLLVGDTVFADAETYPFADTIYRLIKGRFLNATSVSWFPLKWKNSQDRNRPDGVDYLEQKLLEISVVPVPANPAALVTARSVGIDTAPLCEWAERVLDLHQAIPMPRREIETIYRDTRGPAKLPRPARDEKWKCAASRNLMLDDSSDWNAEAARASIFAACGFDTDKPDLGKARKAFLSYDDANPRDKASYRLGVARMIGGRMVAIAAGLRAASAQLAKADLPTAVQEKARATIKHYEDQMGTKTAAAVVVTKRGLYAVSELAYLLGGLGWIKSSVDQEEAAEGDTDSKNPANMLAALHAVGKALTDMAEEEVSELIAQYGPIEDIDPGVGAERAIKDFKARAARAGRKLSKDDTAALNDIQSHCARSARLMRSHIDTYADEDLADEDTRAAMLDNAEAVHDHCAASADKLRSYIDQRSTEGAQTNASNPETGTGDPGARAAADAGPKNAAALAADEAAAREKRRAEAVALRVKSILEE